MAIKIATQKPNYFGLTGTQPVGQTQIAVAAEWAGTITSVTRVNTRSWGVTTRDARDAFRAPKLGASASIWFDRVTGEYVVDYWPGSAFAGRAVEAGRGRTIGAAIGVAVDSTARRWAEAQ